VDEQLSMRSNLLPLVRAKAHDKELISKKKELKWQRLSREDTVQKHLLTA